MSDIYHPAYYGDGPDDEPETKKDRQNRPVVSWLPR